MNKKSLMAMWNDMKLVVLMLTDYIREDYINIPTNTVAAIAVMLIYIISPIDFIPDFILGLGFIDDFIVIKIVLMFVKKDLEQYELWRNKQKKRSYKCLKSF
ncbi:MAG: YkvA family protein [Sulfurimonas sp.]|nr:YkvA family protein [Sulfurimonas sp.]